MLSTSLHSYAPVFAHLPSHNLDQHPQDPSTSGLNNLGSPAHYPIHHFHAGRPGNPTDEQFLKHRQHPYRAGARGHRDPIVPARAKSSTAAPVRRRISRACDQCNQLRTKCDGKNPCAHCVEFSLTCEYVRERKKRGKASRKDIAQQQAAAAASSSEISQQTSSSTTHLQKEAETANPDQITEEESDGQKDQDPISPTEVGHGTHLFSDNSASQAPATLPNHEGLQHLESNGHISAQQLNGVGVAHRNVQQLYGLPEYHQPVEDYHRPIIPQPPRSQNGQVLQGPPGVIPHPLITPNNLPYGENGYIFNPHQQGPSSGFPLSTGESPMSAGFLGSSSVSGSPGWLSLPSPSAMYAGQPKVQHLLRYPVLRPVLPYVEHIIPMHLACDLLDLYFQSTTSVFMKPACPYVLGYTFRKRSFLRSTNPRACSPALLASMLCVAAQTNESVILTTPPSARATICQKLLDLTISLLKPLVHSPSPSEGQNYYGSNGVMNGVPYGMYGVGSTGRLDQQDGASTGATGSVDDVATYVHIATVASASENKGASLRWWNAAWQVARELKLGRELPANPPPVQTSPGGDADADGEVDMDMSMTSNSQNLREGPDGANGIRQSMPPGSHSEEDREERRRLWWLLYAVDRHLALCYNKPLFLMDIECDGLLQPLDEAIWQAGDYFRSDVTETQDDPCSAHFRRRGPQFECTGLNIFGWFLPLMTILGGIVDLNHARNHPRFGLRVRSPDDWDDQAEDIIQQLDVYAQSLQEFETRFSTAVTEGESGIDAPHHEVGTPSAHSVSSVSRANEALMQLRIVMVYATHLMHTLHILLNGKWDPISLLDDNDLWISSQSFIAATGHAVSAAEALDDILEHDPDLTQCPFFFGIYLLQSSFLLLLIAEKLKGEASPNVVKACETIVRAHEACIVTLNTEYQRNFRKVMRSALAQVRGRLLEDEGEAQRRRREVLALYRWAGDGSGLAL